MFNLHLFFYLLIRAAKTIVMPSNKYTERVDFALRYLQTLQLTAEAARWHLVSLHAAMLTALDADQFGGLLGTTLNNFLFSAQNHIHQNPKRRTSESFQAFDMQATRVWFPGQYWSYKTFFKYIVISSFGGPYHGIWHVIYFY